jgi:hypothetical protein
MDVVISTKGEARVEKSAREEGEHLIRSQMSRLRFAPLDMTRALAYPHYLQT